MDAVVTHVAHAAQHHALRKAPGTPIVTRPQLPEHGDQRIADQGIDFVDQQHQRSGIGLAPAGQRFTERAIAEGGEDVGPCRIQELVAQRVRP